LTKEAGEIRSKYAWSRREVSEGMLEDMQADEHDDKIDQYEYVVASLLLLNKINAEDIKPIMDKFRTLARGEEYIRLELDVPREESDTMHSD
jgi:oligoendopeptidase F